MDPVGRFRQYSGSPVFSVATHTGRRISDVLGLRVCSGHMRDKS